MHKERAKFAPAARESTVHRSPIVPKSPWAEIKKSVLLAKLTCTEASKDVVLIIWVVPELPDIVLTCHPQLQSVALALTLYLEQDVTLLICKRCPHCKARTLEICKSLKSYWRTLSMRARSCQRQTLGRAKPTKMADTLRHTMSSIKVKPWKLDLGKSEENRAKKKKPSKYINTC